MKKSLKPVMLFLLALSAVMGVMAQPIPIMEMPVNANPLGNSNYGFGSSIVPVVTEFKKDAFNNDNFSTYFPRSTFSVSLTNQQFTGLNYGTANYNGTGVNTLQTTGLVFGIGPSLASDPLPQGGNPLNRYDNIGAYSSGGPGGPNNAMFTSSPTAVGAELGTGLNVGAGTPSKKNAGVEVFTTAQVLFNDTIAYPRGSRVYFGDLVLTFNYAVSNPVIHLAGLGGAYRYLPVGQPNFPANYISTFFSTELELQTPGLTSTLMSSNAYMTLSGNNILNNNDVNPNGGSRVDATEFINNAGAATGSVRINGTVTQLVYRVYLQGGTGSQFAWSALGSLTGAPRDPLTGDIWYVGASFKEPVLQIISGTVFNDKDGLVDNNISTTLESVGPVSNPTTNAGNLLYANLISGGLVIATKPIEINGAYLFDNVAPGTYIVQISTNQGVAGQPQPATALPAGWVNTGEFNGLGAGSDGSVNGLSATIVVVANDIKTDNNFGIERLPDSKNFTTVITTPPFNATITLNTPGDAPYGNLPVLSGSDPEDQVAEGVLTGKSVKFTTLATVGSNNAAGVLKYNGVTITLNQVIPNFNAALLTVTLNTPWSGSGLKFNYAYVDAAGMPDPTPALYRLLWSGGGPLVINLSEFNAVKNNCIANLNWKTSKEVNGDRFEVQVSTNTNSVYTTAGTILATGNSSTVKSYQYSFNMQPGVIYYFKLKMIDKDGSFTYSDIRSLNCSNGKTGIVVAPNPVIDIFTVRGMENGKNIIAVYSSNGQLVKTQIIAQNYGEVNVSYLAPGMYTVKVTSETGNTVISKLIKY